MGLLSTDEELYYDPRTAPYVSVLGSQPQIFFSQFSVSMTNLGNIVNGTSAFPLIAASFDNIQIKKKS